MFEDWEMIEQCWLSGQITEADMATRLTDDPDFQTWFLERLTQRAEAE